MSSLAMTAATSLREIVKPYRSAVFEQLEAVVFPNAPSMRYPVTLDLAWVVDDARLDTNKVIETPGALRFTAGGAYLSGNEVLPCDFTYISSYLKSPIPYTDTARLNIVSNANPEIPAAPAGTNATAKATVVVRGVIRLSSPLSNAV